MGPDTFDFRRAAVLRLIGAGGDNFAVTFKDDKQPLRRQIPLGQLDLRIARKIVAIARRVFGEQAVNNRLEFRRFR
jgi:hypothetical protein